jgi:hypothetical protein
VKNRRRLLLSLFGALIFAKIIGLGQLSVARFKFEGNFAESEIYILMGAFLLGISFLFFLLISGWNGFFQSPMKEYLTRFGTFLRQNPMFIYVGSYVLIILLAQLIDWKILSREGLRYVREEVIEWVAGIQLIMAGLSIPKRGKGKNEIGAGMENT